MANRIIFNSWERPTPGKEQKAMQLWPRFIEFIGFLKATERIENFEAALLARHGGDMNGFIMIKLDADQLVDLVNDDTWLDLNIAASDCLDHYASRPGYIGDGFEDIMTRYGKVITS